MPSVYKGNAEALRQVPPYHRVTNRGIPVILLWSNKPTSTFSPLSHLFSSPSSSSFSPQRCFRPFRHFGQIGPSTLVTKHLVVSHTRGKRVWLISASPLLEQSLFPGPPTFKFNSNLDFSLLILHLQPWCHSSRWPRSASLSQQLLLQSPPFPATSHNGSP